MSADWTEDDEIALIDAANRDEDPDGDADALDPGDGNEPPADRDPEPLLNDDAADDLSGFPEGEDDGVDDYSQIEDDGDDDPEPEPDTEGDGSLDDLS